MSAFDAVLKIKSLGKVGNSEVLPVAHGGWIYAPHESLILLQPDVDGRKKTTCQNGHFEFIEGQIAELSNKREINRAIGLSGDGEYFAECAKCGGDGEGDWCPGCCQLSRCTDCSGEGEIPKDSKESMEPVPGVILGAELVELCLDHVGRNSAVQFEWDPVDLLGRVIFRSKDGIAVLMPRRCNRETVVPPFSFKPEVAA